MRRFAAIGKMTTRPEVEQCGTLWRAQVVGTEGANVADSHQRLTRQRANHRPIHRVATISVHTSPIDQPGTGDAGGMNVYILEVARRMADAGVAVEIFTRATSSDLPPVVEVAPGVHVRHVIAGPFEGLAKEELPAQLCAFTNGVLRAEAARPPGFYDVIHSHYWLSGQVGWLAKERWGVPLVHSAHTLAKVKNARLAAGDRPEPRARVIGEEQVVAEADRLVANTYAEAGDLVRQYAADPALVSVVEPGVDLDRFQPPAVGREVRARLTARRHLGLPEQGYVVAFVGRIQPLKAPDVLLRAAAALHTLDPAVADRLTVVIAGGPSGSGLDRPTSLMDLAHALGIADSVRFLPPQTGADLPALYRAADLVAVPSYNESFGLVALEAQACGTPVVAAAVGGLATAVQDGVSGNLVVGHDPVDWARILGDLLAAPARRAELARGAVRHARNFSWARTAAGLLEVYGGAVVEHRSRIAAEMADGAAALGAGAW
jgi:D-inositol-3-phosphate glycosyltransferase